jgi:hypothetical protein
VTTIDVRTRTLNLLGGPQAETEEIERVFDRYLAAWQPGDIALSSSEIRPSIAACTPRRAHRVRQ